MRGTRLAWIEHLLPGSRPDERLGFARGLDLTLEVALREELDVEALIASEIEVSTVAAWQLHAAHALSPREADVERARAHVLAAIDLAVRVGAPRVLTVCGFAREPVSDPLERCAEFFDSLEHDARERGVRVLIEPLSRERTTLLAGPEPVIALLDNLPRDVFGVALDTGHLLDHGLDPLEVLGTWDAIDELQVRGAGGAFPGPELPLEEWLRACPWPPAVVVPEYREPASRAASAELVGRLRHALGDG